MPFWGIVNIKIGEIIFDQIRGRVPLMRETMILKAFFFFTMHLLNIDTKGFFLITKTDFAENMLKLCHINLLINFTFCRGRRGMS